MILDCFTFFNELELLEIRLRHLWEHVDRFVLVEASHNHRGIPKPFVFQEHAHEFAWASEKLISLQYTYPDPSLPGWGLENEQRNAIWLCLRNTASSDIVMVGDLDELPSHHGIQVGKNMIQNGEPGPLTLLQKFHYYYVNNVLTNGRDISNSHFYENYWWYGTVMAADPSTIIPQQLRENRYYNQGIPEGGHHFSCLGGIESIIQKANSIADAKLANLSPKTKFLRRLWKDVPPSTKSADTSHTTQRPIRTSRNTY